MIFEQIQALRSILDSAPSRLRQINSDSFKKKKSSKHWSKQEILGHLIDSATNNHQRFIRSQYEHSPNIPYNQDEWNTFNFYNKANTNDLISFWELYNRQILLVLENFSIHELEQKCRTGSPEEHTLAFLFCDYVKHLEHHLQQILTDVKPSRTS